MRLNNNFLTTKKVLDPQSALLTNAEVYQFLKSNPPRAPDNKVGAYAALNLTGYNTIRQDFDRYIEKTTPYTNALPPPETWMLDLVTKLKPYELTKPEVLSLINLGTGSRGPSEDTETNGDVEMANGETDEVDAEAGEQQGEEPSGSLDRLLFSLVVEEAEERFPGDAGDRQVDEILKIINLTILTANQKTNGAVGNKHSHD